MNRKKLFGRAVALLMITAMLVSVCPMNLISWRTPKAASQAVLSDGTIPVSAQELPTEVVYILNGGEFDTSEGYTPVTKVQKGENLVLPGDDNISRPGYTFGGWYDNRNLEGSPLTEAVAEDTEIVVFAKWLPRSYSVTIPDTIQLTEAGELEVSAECLGFFNDDSVSISVESANNWNLVSGSETAKYDISDKNAEFAKTGVTTLEYEVLSGSEYLENATDTLTFDISFNETRYDVTLVQGNSSETLSLAAGTKIGELPVGTMNGSVFVGWSYDVGFQNMAEDDDEIISNTMLYAKFVELEESEPVEYSHAAFAYDSAPDFTVSVSSGKPITADELCSKITFTNATHPDESGFFTVTPTEGTAFTLSGKNGGFTPGCTYKLELNDKSLWFTDCGSGETAPSEYNFSITKQETLNVRISDKLIYLPVEALSQLTVNGVTKSAGITPADVLPSTEISKTQDDMHVSIEGSFRYTGSSEGIVPGAVVAIYSGEKPDLSADEVISTSRDVSCIEVVSVDSDGMVHYCGAGAEDVLFVPDVIPVPANADKDGNSFDDHIMVAESYFDFSTADSDLRLALNVDTTVDEGDFIALCTGTGAYDLGSISGYGRIDSVSQQLTESGVYYVIDYTPVSDAEVLSSMDTYYSRYLTEEELDGYIDVSALENSVRQQALDSGFVDNASNYLMLSLLQSQDFSDELLRNNINPEEMVLADAAGDIIMTGRAASTAKPVSKVEVAVKYVVPKISTSLEYYKNHKGLRLSLKVEVEVTAHVNTKTDIKFTVDGEFQQEIDIKVGVSGEAEWSYYNGVLPYISEFTLSLNTDLYEYTGFSVEISFALDKGEIGSLGRERGKLGEAMKFAEGMPGKFKDMAELKKQILDDDEAISFELAEKYSEMLEAAEDLDYVNLYTLRDALYIKATLYQVVEAVIAIDLIIDAKVDVVVGSQFWYASAKRNIYTIELFAREVTHKTVQLEPEVYEFNFYIMGALGIRAGIQLRMEIGLISVDLDSIGDILKTGAYVEAYGYFYYTYKHTDNKGTVTVDSNYAGAMFIEIGVFLHIGLVMQIDRSALSYEVEVYDNQWPIASFGEQINILDFVWDQSELTEMNMKGSVERAFPHDSLFTMKYLDLKEGARKVGKDTKDEHFEYGNIHFDSSAFNITSTNDKFVYNANLNCIEVNPTEGDRTLDGEITITYKKAPLTFTGKPIQRKIKVHWDNLRTGYFLNFDSKGGTYVSTIEGRYGAEVKAPEAPTRLGYEFVGWYDENGLTKLEVPATMPADSMYFYAKWTPVNVTYTVEHYIESLNGGYEKTATEVLSALAGTSVTPAVKNYEGFTAPSLQTHEVSADGSTVIRYYYTRNTYTVTFKMDSSIDLSETKADVTYTLKYGAQLTTPGFGLQGYVLEGWYTANNIKAEIPENMPAENLEFTAKWTPSENTPYRVNIYWQKANGLGYELRSSEVKTGTTGEYILYNTPACPSGYRYNNLVSKNTATLAGDGSTVIRICFDRLTYNITYDYDGGESKSSDVKTEYRFEETVFMPKAVRRDYAFTGWYEVLEDGSVKTEKFSGVMPENNITLRAGWEKGTGYTIEHYLMNEDQPEGADGITVPYQYSLIDSEDLYIQEGQKLYPVTLSAISFDELKRIAGLSDDMTEDGFYWDAQQVVEVVTGGGIDANVFKFYYNRNKYSITYNNGSTQKTCEAYYGKRIGYSAPDTTREWYTFTGWYTDPSGTGNKADGSLISGDMTVYGRWKETLHTCVLHYYDGESEWTRYISGYANISVIDPPQISRTGYTLKWYIDEGSSTRLFDWPSGKHACDVFPDRDCVVNAVWETIPYTVTIECGEHCNYNYEGKYRSGVTISYDVESALVIEPAVADKGYVFTGWNVTYPDNNSGSSAFISDSGNAKVISKGCVGNLKFTANVKAVTTKLNLKDKENSDTDTRNPVDKTVNSQYIQATYGQVLPTLNNTVYIPERAGYTFKGYVNSAGDMIYKPVYSNSKITGIAPVNGSKVYEGTSDITLYARWEVKTYTIKFDYSKLYFYYPVTGTANVTLYETSGGSQFSFNSMEKKYNDSKFLLPSKEFMLVAKDNVGTATKYRIIGYDTDPSALNIVYDAGSGSKMFSNDSYKDVVTLYPVCMPIQISSSNIYSNGQYSDTAHWIPTKNEGDNDYSIVRYYILNPGNQNKGGNGTYYTKRDSATTKNKYEASCCNYIYYATSVYDTEVLRRYCTSMKISSVDFGVYSVEDCKVKYDIDISFTSNGTSSLYQDELTEYADSDWRKNNQIHMLDNETYTEKPQETNNDGHTFKIGIYSCKAGCLLDGSMPQYIQEKLHLDSDGSWCYYNPTFTITFSR